MNVRLGSIPSFGERVAETITAAKVLTNGDCGKVFYLDSTDAAYTITLPSVRAGLHFKFIVQEDTPSEIITITGAASTIYGILEQKSVTNQDNRVVCNGKTSVIIGVNSLKGDLLEFESDGTSWYVKGYSSVQTEFSTA